MTIAAILSFAGKILEPVITSIRKKYFSQPKLDFRFVFFSGSNSLIFPNNVFSKITWKYQIEVYNNSEHSAHKLKIIRPKENEIFT
ncbi:MAG: hypothetical protein RJA07_1897 [Bacteroidota bacterium]|jgi:hypothetical protein